MKQLALVLACMCLLFACEQRTQPATEVIVMVTANDELTAGVDLTGVEFDISDAEGENPLPTRNFVIGSQAGKSDERTLPLTFSIRRGKQDAFRLAVVGTGPDNMLIVQRYRVRFAHGKSMLLKVVLDGRCRDLVCTDDATSCRRVAGEVSCSYVPELLEADLTVVDPSVVVLPADNATFPSGGSGGSGANPFVTRFPRGGSGARDGSAGRSSWTRRGRDAGQDDREDASGDGDDAADAAVPQGPMESAGDTEARAGAGGAAGRSSNRAGSDATTGRGGAGGKDATSAPHDTAGQGIAPAPAADPCATDNGGCDARVSCTADNGTVVCGACPEHWQLVDKHCVDVDECKATRDDCDDDPAACENTENGYRCVCPSGFTGDGRGVDGCVPVPAPECDDAGPCQMGV